MLEQFLNHIEAHKLFERSDKILLAVSGGIDSMVMLHLFREAGWTFGVAHCNFQLRGEASNADEALINMACVEAGIPFHLKRFDTSAHADANGLSTQMAARELRYDFFASTSREKNYRYVATAHHLNDSIETVLLNLVRGTGIDGLVGIPVKQQNIVRPLQFATREVIAAYAALHRIQWREDESNESDKYQRNLLRIHVLPQLKKINPSLEHSFQFTLERVIGASLLAKQSLQQFARDAVVVEGDRTRINKARLLDSGEPAVVLWETIKDRGFNFVQCKDVVGTNHQTGKIFSSQTHQITVDRDDLIVSPLTNTVPSDIAIDQPVDCVTRGMEQLTFVVQHPYSFSIDKDPAVAQLDWQKVRFPLTWRSWRAGDRFVPLGMAHQKKLSDFLVDLKVSIPDKEKVTVLESAAGEIVWVVGYRVSDRFKVSTETETLLRVRLHRD